MRDWCNWWRQAVLAVLVAVILAHAPWRLSALFVETLAVDTGPVQLRASADGYWVAQRLEQRLSQLGWHVEYIPALNVWGMPVYGATFPGERAVRIAAELSWADRAAVLAHEGAHGLQPPRLTEGQSEVFAESVAMLVAHDGLREHARYLANLRGDLIVMIVEWRAIYRAAAVLEG